MRFFRLALFGVLLAGMTVLAQQPAAPALDPAKNPLDALLIQWQNKMQSVQTLSADCTRTVMDNAFKTNEIYEGTAKYMKPDLAALKLTKRNNPNVYEQFISTGTFLYEFVPQQKTVRVHEMQQRPGQGADFLSFLFGMKAEEAKRRYDLTLVKGPPQDPHYYYVDILPKFAEDKAEFQKARLVLMAATFLPRQLWFVQPNGNAVTWDIPRMDPNAALNRNEFGVPALPQGWNVVRVPKQTAPANPQQPPPRVVRPQQQGQ